MSSRPAPSRTVLARGLRFAVHATHPADGAAATPPVVLVHGIGMSHRYLALLHRELARDRSVLSVDLPGFGGLPKPARDVPIPAMAEALGDVLDELFAAPVVLVGQSMGTQWTIELGRRRPDLVAGVVAIGPVADDHHRTLGAQARALALDSLRERPRTNAILLVDYLRCGMRWYLTQLRHMLRYPSEDAVADLAAPLLVLRGGRDPIAGSEWCRRLAARAAHGASVTVPGGPHNVQDARPRAVAAAIRAHADGWARAEAAR